MELANTQSSSNGCGYRKWREIQQKWQKSMLSWKKEEEEREYAIFYYWCGVNLVGLVFVNYSDRQAI